MTWRAAYVLGSSIYQISMLMGAAYFHNWWSVLFVLLVLASEKHLSRRVLSWEIDPNNPS